MRTRSVGTLLALLVAVAAPVSAADAAPSRLWYKVAASYTWKSDFNVVYHDGTRTEHTAFELSWKAKTPTGSTANEAPLVRRDRESGRVSFGEKLTAYAEGTMTKSGGTITQTLLEPPGQNYYNCLPVKFQARHTLIGRPRIRVLLGISDDGPVADPVPIDADPRGAGTDLTGPTTCQRCLDPHPYRYTNPTYFDDGSCVYEPGAGSEGLTLYTPPYRHGRILEDVVRDGHSFTARGRFGARRMTASSTSTGFYESTGGQLADAHDRTETVTETITIVFTRCPSAGRRPC